MHAKFYASDAAVVVILLCVTLLGGWHDGIIFVTGYILGWLNNQTHHAAKS